MKSVIIRAVLSCICLVGQGLTKADEFVPLIGFDRQLFPSFIISTATMRSAPAENSGEALDAKNSKTITLGDARGLLGIQLTSPGRGVSVKVTVTCDEVMEPSTFSGSLPAKGVEYRIYPRIRYRFSKLAEVRQATPVSMTFRVQVGSSEPLEQTASVLLRPINDCPFLVIEGERVINTSFTFAAYVNEQHPYIDKLLREALDIGVVDSFTGYQSKDSSEVIRQVYAIWDALVARDVRYSSITATSGEAETVVSQHVRLIDESLNNSQANCVDGSVLFAAALRKIGIEPFLVLVPGHCYVGFYVDESQENLLAVETTMLGRSFEDEEEYDTTDELEEAVTEDLQDEYSWPSFASAVVAATSDLEENKEKFASTDSEGEGYLLIEIAAARKMGILPIAFRGKEEFVSNGLGEASAEEEMSEDAADEETSEEETDECDVEKVE